MSQPAPGAEPGPWREVAGGVYVCLAQPASVNLGLVVGSAFALVVDTGSSPGQGRLLRSAAKDVTDAPIQAAVATHWHYDHSFGLAGFRDVVTFAHESVAARLHSPEAAEFAAKLGIEASDLAQASREVAVAAALDLGGRRVEIAHLGRGHTDGDLVVVVPDANVIFAGDLIESANAPWYGDDSFPHEWAATLDSVIGLMTAGTVAVPGHGEPVNREFVFGQRGRVAAVSGEIRRLSEAGVSAPEALRAGSWPFPAEHIADGMGAGYRQLEVSSRKALPLI
jgi:glyoxylase-like metal-dependent hydrolase (beta-lactamase superfamily II)